MSIDRMARRTGVLPQSLGADDPGEDSMQIPGQFSLQINSLTSIAGETPTAPPGTSYSGVTGDPEPRPSSIHARKNASGSTTVAPRLRARRASLMSRVTTVTGGRPP